MPADSSSSPGGLRTATSARRLVALAMWSACKHWCPRCGPPDAERAQRRSCWFSAESAEAAQWKTGSETRPQCALVSWTWYPQPYLSVKCPNTQTPKVPHHICILRIQSYLNYWANLGKQRSLFFYFLHTVGHQPLHCLGAVLVEPAKIWGSISTAHHEDDLKKETVEQTSLNTETNSPLLLCQALCRSPDLGCWCVSREAPRSSVHTAQCHRSRHQTGSWTGCYPAFGLPLEPMRTKYVSPWVMDSRDIQEPTSQRGVQALAQGSSSPKTKPLGSGLCCLKLINQIPKTVHKCCQVCTQLWAGTCIVLRKLCGASFLTIHSTEPVGCSTCWEPLQRDFTVAKPKSPIFTVRPSWRNISQCLLRRLTV